ncbi:MAG: hypothetical protein ACR2I0_14985, partial [Rhodoferax sp.]
AIAAAPEASEDDALIQQEMAQMDFPARLIHLKIENDKVRNELENLEHMMDAASAPSSTTR